MTEPEPLQQIDRTFVVHRGRKLSYFSGCDYFRLASHPAVLKAASTGLKEFGLNVAASRLTTGNHKLYQALERDLADFFAAESALLVSSGYITNLTVAQALAGNFSHALIDERSHPTLLDAASFLDCPVLKFKHRDVDDFERTLKRLGPETRVVVLTDGMFSHDGSVAPLRFYLEQLPKDGLLMVDDAHGAGVLGETGKGTIESEGIDRSRLIQCITLSKAFGVYGGAVIGARRWRQLIVERSRIFAGSTPLPLPLANAARTAVKILAKGATLRRRLFQNTAYVKNRLRDAGLFFPETPGPIVPIVPSTQRDISALKRRLLAAGIYPPFLVYPGGPRDGYFRFVTSSEHSREQLDGLVRTLAEN